MGSVNGNDPHRWRGNAQGMGFGQFRRRGDSVCTFVSPQCHCQGRRGVRDVSPPIPEQGVQGSISPEPRDKPRWLCQERGTWISVGAQPSKPPPAVPGAALVDPSGVLEIPPHHQRVQSSSCSFQPGCTFLSFLPSHPGTAQPHSCP